MMLCRRYLPSLQLRPYVAWYWTLEQRTEKEQPIVYRLVPDAHVDWVFHLEAPWQFIYRPNHNSKKRFQTHLFGHSTGFIELEVANKLEVFGIKFHPWTAHLFCNTHMGATTNQEIVLTDLPAHGISGFVEEMLLAADTEKRIQLAEHYLSNRLMHFDSLQRIIQQLSWDRFDSKPNFNNRRLQQRFKSEIGISPKIYQRTLRVNRVIDEMQKHPLNLTDIAYQYGYYDQSHFIRDFQKFTGLSPRQFIKSIDPSEDFLNLRVE